MEYYLCFSMGCGIDMKSNESVRGESYENEFAK
jgi:hypothetical protein